MRRFNHQPAIYLSVLSFILSNCGAAPRPTFLRDGSRSANEHFTTVTDTAAASADAIHVYKAELKRGTVHPTYWMHDSNDLIVTKQGSNTPNPYDYADLWLAQQLTVAFALLEKAPFSLKGVSHLGIYNYRKIAGSANLSRHSHALAIDLSGFTLANGTKITVEHDWKSGANSKILHDIRNMLCKHFDVVLSPDYNKAHYNHFHIDLNPKNRDGHEAKNPVWQDLEDKPSRALFAADPEEETADDLPEEEESDGHSYLTSSGSTCR
jgi:hypothetical protein